MLPSELAERLRRGVAQSKKGRAIRRERAQRNPPFLEAVIADARIALAYRAEPWRFTSKVEGVAHAVRLMWAHDSFFALVLYRAKASCLRRGVPILPQIAHKLAMASSQVCIGDPVVVEPGIYLAHGQVVIDGFAYVHSGAVFYPWVTIGLRAGDFSGPTIGPRAQIGTGAKVLGPVTVGERAMIGANAVVLDDVPPEATAVGVPARVVGNLQASAR